MSRPFSQIFPLCHVGFVVSWKGVDRYSINIFPQHLHWIGGFSVYACDNTDLLSQRLYTTNGGFANRDSCYVGQSHAILGTGPLERADGTGGAAHCIQTDIEAS